MKSKEYLSQAFRIDQRINSKLEQVLSLRKLADKTATTVPKSDRTNARQITNYVNKMSKLESEINADIDRLVDLKSEIVTVIKCVESPELQTLLELRYLSFKTWEQIAVEMNFDARWVRRLHDRALAVIDKIRCKNNKP